MSQNKRAVERLSGRELADLRLKAGLTQAELAQAAGIGRHAVSHWERKDAVDGSQYTPRRMLAALGVRLAPAPFGNAIARARGDGVLELERAAIAGRVARRAAKAQENARLWQSQRKVPCEARTRKCQPCRLLSEAGRRRCKFHGGKSTGPKTLDGRARIAEAQRRRWAAWRDARLKAQEP